MRTRLTRPRHLTVADNSRRTAESNARRVMRLTDLYTEHNHARYMYTIKARFPFKRKRLRLNGNRA